MNKSILLTLVLFATSFHSSDSSADNTPTNQYTSQTAKWLCSTQQTKGAAETISSDTVDADGWYAIHWAVVCNTLSKKDESIYKQQRNVQTLAGFTPLMLSIIHYNNLAFDQLILWGADPNTQDKQGRSSLHHALIKGNEPLVNILLEHGADPALCDSKGLSTLHYALFTDNMSLIKRFVTLVPAHQPSQDGRTPFDVAAQYGNLEAFNLLVDAFIHNKELTFNCGIPKSDATTKINNQNSMCTSASAECLQAALQKPTINGITIAHYAATNNNVAILEQLNSHSVSLNQPTEQGWLPTHYAAMYGATESLTFLLNHDESASTINTTPANQGWTPLHCAAIFDRQKAVALLVKDPENVDGKLLDGSTALHCAAMQGHTTIVKLLLEKGANSAAQNYAGWTPLHIAAQYNKHDIITMLLDHKSSITMQNNDGNTPYDIALMNDAAESIELLKDSTAAITLNENGLDHYTIKPVLDITTKRPEFASPIAKDSIDRVRLLIEQGESVDQSYRNIRLLDIPMHNGNEEMATVLFKHSIDSVSTKNME